LTDATKVAFEKAEKVAFEINMEEMSDMSVIFSLMGKIMMSGGTTLKDLLSEEDYAFVEKKFNEMGLPIAMLGRMKPMFLSTFASGADSGGDTGGGGGMGGLLGGGGDMVSYEMKFMEMAQGDNKEMAGLETIEFQLSMFDSIPYEAQAEMLVESLKANNNGNDQLKDMVNLYKNQDIEGMQKMFDAEEGGLDGYQDLLLVKRNENWIPIMKEMMMTKSTFFAVGAGHLGGKKGVIDLLRQAGYKMKPLY
ncbi:MAG: TraB/GumN family protein, partial [Bacteroidota bacterium]